MMKRILICLFALVSVAQDIWAQTVYNVTTETQLNDAITAITNGAITNGATNIVLRNDITLTNRVVIDAEVTVSIDLNGCELSRGNPETADTYGHVLIIGGGANVTIKDSSTDGTGQITGGNADAGGGIWIGPRGTVTLESGKIWKCNSSGKGGGIYNKGNLIINGGTIRDNTATDGGGIYNEEGATLTLTGGNIASNKATSDGAGVSNYGTLNMQGNIAIVNNFKNSNSSNTQRDLYLPGGKVINVTGAFTTGAAIGITLSGSQTLTSGYSTYNGSTDPNTIFHHDPIVTSTGDLTEGTISLVGGEVYFSSPEKYITEVMLIGSTPYEISTNLKSKYEKEGWTFIDKNLNDGRESHPHVHLLYKSEPAEAVNYDKHYITGFLLADNTLSEQDFTNQETIVHDGRTYYKVPAVNDQGFIDCGGNLNYSVSNNSNQGDKIFLYYTRDKFDDNRVVKSIVFDGSDSGALGDLSGKKDHLDLNRSGSGDYIYMHVGTTTGVTYTPKDQTLADNSNNSNVLTVLNGKTPNITLDGRTLWKDGSWNTLCLPFNYGKTGPLAGATIMELDATGTYGGKQTGFASDGTLYLYFKNADEIEAGKPYIVKWTTTGDNIENPTFNNVTITSTTPTTVIANNSGLNTVQFIGTYGPANLVANDKAKLYIGASNNLYYPSGDMNINAFRAYFNVDLTGQPSGVRAFVLNFGDDSETSGIENVQCSMVNVQSESWFTLDGRRLNGKPSRAGVYINNGNKVVIK